MQTLEPKNSIIYGPVNSRRLGRSLGINILPAGMKYCTFNCVYCQYGWNKIKFDRNDMNDIAFPTIIDIKNALLDALEELKSEENLPAYLTLSGNGEPTLHPDFFDIVEAIIEIRDKIVPSAKTTILSNSSEVNSDEICNALCLLDQRIMKFDCGNSAVLNRFNKPVEGITLDRIAEELCRLSRRVPIYIQTLFASGKCGNMHEEDLNSWAANIKKINPEMVQIYSLSRGYPAKSIEPAGKEELFMIKARLEVKGIPCGVY